ncbi:MAG: metallophosphoesterase [Hyphomonadaceae bacterium]
MIHPLLWPAVLGACVALPLLFVGFAALALRWHRLNRRRRMLCLAALALFEAAYWLNVYAWLIEPNLLVVRRVTVESAQWHGPPITIAALGDTHVASPHVNARRVGDVVQRINQLRPDLVVLLGDYVGGGHSPAQHSAAGNFDIMNGLAVFGALDARLGAVAVLGNHDSYYGRAAIAEALQNAGVAVLWNRSVVIRRPQGGEFVVAGLADSDTGDPDYAAAVDGAPTGADVIVIAHAPDPFAQTPSTIALMLAAHTHCGQVTVPFLGRIAVKSRFGQRYACHRVDENGKTLFVTAGLGTSFLPVRFLNPPEIALITLRAKPR